MKEYRSNRTPPSLTARWRFPLVRDRLAMQLWRLERAISATCTTAHDDRKTKEVPNGEPASGE